MFPEIYIVVLTVSFVMGKVIRVLSVLLEIQMEIRETGTDRRVQESAYGL